MVRLGVLYTLNHGSSPCEQTTKNNQFLGYIKKKQYLCTRKQKTMFN